MGNVKVPDLNVAYVAGRLTRDPDLRYTASGMAYCRLGIANSRFYKDKSGERKEDTLFVDAVLWGKSAEYAGENLRKGRPVLVEGSLTSNEWEDKQGQKRSKIEVKAHRVSALDWEDDAKGGGKRHTSPQARPQQGGAPEPEDDLPF